jgi:predicted lipase
MEHETVVDMLRLTTLVYKYNDTTKQQTRVNEYTSIFGANPEYNALLAKYPEARIVKFISDDETGVQVGITINESKKRICIVFRGTNSSTDWRYNLQTSKMFIKPSTFGDICIHAGFCKQLFQTNLYNSIFSLLQTLLRQNPEYELFVTGHSAGGALSTLFGYLLSGDIPAQKIQVVSFASPRIGNSEFKRDFENKLFLSHHRVTNRNDIVTALPLFKYCHVGNKVYIRSKTTSFCCCVNVWDHSTDAYHANLLDMFW